MLRYNSKKLHEHFQDILQDAETIKQHADEQIDMDATASTMRMRVTAISGDSQKGPTPGREASDASGICSGEQRVREVREGVLDGYTDPIPVRTCSRPVVSR